MHPGSTCDRKKVATSKRKQQFRSSKILQRFFGDLSIYFPGSLNVLNDLCEDL